LKLQPNFVLDIHEKLIHSVNYINDRNILTEARKAHDDKRCLFITIRNQPTSKPGQINMYSVIRDVKNGSESYLFPEFSTLRVICIADFDPDDKINPESWRVYS
jgi:hypothetical protein